jgi:hypothetical protein
MTSTMPQQAAMSLGLPEPVKSAHLLASRKLNPNYADKRMSLASISQAADGFHNTD